MIIWLERLCDYVFRKTAATGNDYCSSERRFKYTAHKPSYTAWWCIRGSGPDFFTLLQPMQKAHRIRPESFIPETILETSSSVMWSSLAHLFMSAWRHACSMKLNSKHMQSFSLQRVLSLRFGEKGVGPLFPLQLQVTVMLSTYLHQRGMHVGPMGSSFIKLIFLSPNTYASSVDVCYRLGPTGGRKLSDFHFTLSTYVRNNVCSFSLTLSH